MAPATVCGSGYTTLYVDGFTTTTEVTAVPRDWLSVPSPRDTCSITLHSPTDLAFCLEALGKLVYTHVITFS